MFLLSFDTGTQIAIRIPCPVVGNVEQTTSSEVASMSYILEKWAQTRSSSMPLPPRVIAWNATYNNPAETPYIILEYAPGVSLQERWDRIQGESAEAAVQSIMDLEYALLHDSFSQHGSLYFAHDVSEELRRRTLYPSDVLAKGDAVVADLAAKYRIGATVNREWWRGEYARVNADRGPCKPAHTTLIAEAFSIDEY